MPDATLDEQLLVLACPCGDWTHEVLVGSGEVDELAVRRAIDDHLDACIVLAATIVARL